MASENVTRTAVRERVISVECPECAGEVGFGRAPLAAEIVRCGECGLELEVVGVDPVRVERAPEVEEDWGE